MLSNVGPAHPIPTPHQHPAYVPAAASSPPRCPCPRPRVPPRRRGRTRCWPPSAWFTGYLAVGPAPVLFDARRPSPSGLGPQQCCCCGGGGCARRQLSRRYLWRGMWRRYQAMVSQPRTSKVTSPQHPAAAAAAAPGLSSSRPGLWRVPIPDQTWRKGESPHHTGGASPRDSPKRCVGLGPQPNAQTRARRPTSELRPNKRPTTSEARPAPPQQHCGKTPRGGC